MMVYLSLVMCMFTMRPLSVTLYLYVILHQLRTARLSCILFEDDEDDYPWTLY